MRKGVDINMIPVDHQKVFQNKILHVRKKYPDCFQSANDIISLTQKGMLYSDRIIPELLFKIESITGDKCYICEY